MAYVIGDLAAEDWAVEALADYLEQYQLTTDGVVRFAHWPQGVKGRFVARVPPLSDD
jgi:predicted metal-binding protein